MNKYCFILGRNPILSLAEIFNYETRAHLDFKVIDLTSQVLIVTSAGANEPQRWQAELGGCIKIGEILESFATPAALQQALEIKNFQRHFIRQTDKKFIFGFSLYGEVFKNCRREFNALGLRLKKELQNQGVKSRFVAAEQDLSSVQVVKNKIVGQGADILVIGGLHSLHLGRTVAVQDFEEYSAKDYGRPQRDMRSGMLPPKLAKIMINLAIAEKTSRLLDPFCGSGTVLQEALFLDYKELIGSDISQKAIADTKKNLAWLSKNFQKDISQVKILLSDVRELDKKIPKQGCDAIVTEPYLGPPITKAMDVINVLATVHEIERLYLDALKILKKIIRPGGRAVFIFPLFIMESGIYSLKILEELEKIGWHRINPLPEKISLFAKVGPTARGSLIYQRPDQHVQREIFIFQFIK